MKCYRCKKTIEKHDSVCEGLHSSCFCSWFHVQEPMNFQDIVMRSTDSARDGWERVTSSFFHGKFRKYSARLGQLQYILKVQQPEAPELPATEYLCNQIARQLGILVPDHFLIRFQNNLDTFVCINFMQDYSRSNLVHIYRYLENPEQYSCEGLVQVIEQQSESRDDVHRFVQLCLFDALIGNHDRHGRNLALIRDVRRSQLAPFYDNPSYLAIEEPMLLGAHHEPRGAVVTQETMEPTMYDYVKEWQRLGFSKPLMSFADRINLKALEDMVNDSFISAKRQLALVNLMKRRYQELCDAM